jgi:biotin-(acetyl-CoA carboxylase) ligase
LAAASYDASTGLPDLPPGFELVALREVGDAFAHACAIAPEAGAGTLVWSRRANMAEFAVVLEPDEPLAPARRAFFAGMNALGDTLAARMPPEKPLEFAWPGTILVDRGLVGGGRLAWQAGVAEHQVPGWLVFGAMVRLTVSAMYEGGATPDSTGLEEEGFEQPDAADIIGGFARHLMAGFDAWREHGFRPCGEAFLARLPGRPEGETSRRGIDAAGDLIVTGADGRLASREGLRAALAGLPAWLDPATGEPVL